MPHHGRGKMISGYKIRESRSSVNQTETLASAGEAKLKDEIIKWRLLHCVRDY